MPRRKDEHRLDAGDNPTPIACFNALKPALGDVARLIKQAPLSPAHRAGLANLLAAWSVGLAASMEPGDFTENVEKVLGVLRHTIVEKEAGSAVHVRHSTRH